MDTAIINNWNAAVDDKDEIYVLGDFSYKGQNPDNYLRRLKGHKHLIIGNHDSKQTIQSRFWESVSDLKTIYILKQRIMLCHYGMRVWNGSFRKSWHLYGHSHGRLPPTTMMLDGKEVVRSFDVGVDCWDFTPISFEQVRSIMNGEQKPKWLEDPELAKLEIGKIEPSAIKEIR